MRICADDDLEGAPDLSAEVAASRAAYDLGEKKKIYERNGVKEYLVWQVFENRLDWLVLQHGEYQLLKANPDGILCSPTFPGLWLEVKALLNNNLVQVNAVLQQGLQSQDHQDFLGKLHQAWA
jgi:Uma2 family endonuclease